jgi:two-component system, cell cycle sensor histidine kinase and response regulator CckA
MPQGLTKRDEKDLFERERKVLEEAKALLSEATAAQNFWSDHYKKLLNEFERVVRQSQSLIRLGDLMQQKLNSITEKLQIEIENHKKTQAEKEASLAQLFQAQKMEALGTLVGGIAHDFNNMLQVVIGYTDFLLSGKKASEPDFEQLQAIMRASKGGAELVKMLLAFGQRGQVFPVPLDLNEQISRLATLVSRTLPPMIQINLELSDGPTTIRADRSQIDQVVMNLAINASDAMPNGGRLKMATRTVSLEDEYCRSHPGVKPGDYVMFSVTDTGRGMDAKTLTKVFDPFFSTKQRGATRGTGLGLSVVKGIVEQQGGHVTCQSELENGTEFKIYFPAIEATPSVAITTTQSFQSNRAETILVVENVSKVAELERETLTSAGYNVIVAANGREALKIYEPKRDEISLVILDLIMPEMSGRDCLMEMLRIEPSVKVIIASGYSPSDDLLKEIKPLVKGFLHKPFGIAQLLESVSSVLSDG